MEQETKNINEIIDLYLDDKLSLDDTVFKMPGIRLEKCIYLLERELGYLKKDEIPIGRIMGYLSIPLEKRLRNAGKKYRHFKFLVSIIPPVVVCKAAAKVYELDFETLWEVIWLFVDEDVIFQVEEE